MNMTQTQEGNVFQAITFATATMIVKMVQMNNLTYVVSVKTFGISMQSRDFLRTVSSIDVISLKIQIVGGNLFKNSGGSNLTVLKKSWL